MNHPHDTEDADKAAEVVAVEAEPNMSFGRALWDFVMQAYCWLLIFLGLYILSVGPFYSSWRQAVDMGNRPLLQVVYLPLAGLCSEFDTINTVVEWYVSFWA